MKRIGDHIWNALAWPVVTIAWWRDRRLCRWAEVTHEPMDGER